MNKNLVFTMCVGADHYAYGRYTLPEIERYAKKVNADYLCLMEVSEKYAAPHWGKYEIYDLLTTYERVMWVDVDCLIRPDCPDVFGLVPPDKFGIVDKKPFFDPAKRDFRHISIPEDNIFHFIKEHGFWYSTGLMIVPRRYRWVFAEPANYPTNHYFLRDQDQINRTIAAGGIDVFDLGFRFDHTPVIDKEIDRFNSWIIHYGGIRAEPLSYMILGEKVRHYERYSQAVNCAS